jgi:hypothetical protein
MLYILGEKLLALYIINAVVLRDLKEDPLGRVIYLFRVLKTPVLTGG